MILLMRQVRQGANTEKTKKALERLMGDIQERNLICLLHGPGGSGKSTVIDAVKAYAVNTLDIHSLTGQSF